MKNGNGTMRLVISAAIGMLTALALTQALLVTPVADRVARCEAAQDSDGAKWEQIREDIGEIKATLWAMQQDWKMEN